MFILIAAFLVSSKYVANPKVRVFVFTSYFIACFFLIAVGCLSTPILWWLISQNTVLVFINIRGIYRAVKDLKNQKRDPFEVIVPKDFWGDILNGEDDNEY